MFGIPARSQAMRVSYGVGPLMSRHTFSRRRFLAWSAMAASSASSRFAFANPNGTSTRVKLEQLEYGQVQLGPSLQQTQFEQTQAVLMGLNEDGLLKPYRLRSGLPAPGPELGGWYDETGADYLHLDHGFAPGANFGQWISALARGYAITGSAATQAKMARLMAGYAATISGRFYEHARFPAYTYDKLVLACIDAEKMGKYAGAFSVLERTTDAALPHLPKRALDRGEEMCSLPHEAAGPKDESYCWDESYTMPENLFLAYQRGAGDKYHDLGTRYLKDDTYFNPLSENENVLPGKHAYSYTNALSSAMQAYLTLGSEKHLRAATNAFRMIQQTQSFATGGWGPDEMFQPVGKGKLADSLQHTHASFETPCGSYAHFKLTRYLLRVTRDARYGDSMEQVMLNTVLGAKRLEADGRAFYYSDYNFDGRRVYYPHAWPCCSGTLPQVATDYGISAYFREPRGMLVNLYVPSTVTWKQNGAILRLQQEGEYPARDHVLFTVQSDTPEEFSLSFRIPAWTRDPQLRVNGMRWDVELEPGTFAGVRRTWKTGDHVDLELPMPLALQPIDQQNPNIVALSAGPQVLFALGAQPGTIDRKVLLTAKQQGNNRWVAQSIAGPISLAPFTSVGDERYSTYLHIA